MMVMILIVVCHIAGHDDGDATLPAIIMVMIMVSQSQTQSLFSLQLHCTLHLPSAIKSKDG